MYITPTVLLCVRMCGTVHSLQDENDSTPESMSLLRKKLGKVMSKSVGRKGTLAALNSALLLLSSLFPLDLLMEIMRRQCLFCVCVCVCTYVHMYTYLELSAVYFGLGSRLSHCSTARQPLPWSHVTMLALLHTSQQCVMCYRIAGNFHRRATYIRTYV